MRHALEMFDEFKYVPEHVKTETLEFSLSIVQICIRYKVSSLHLKSHPTRPNLIQPLNFSSNLMQLLLKQFNKESHQVLSESQQGQTHTDRPADRGGHLQQGLPDSLRQGVPQ